jgi:hypothetical protein
MAASFHINGGKRAGWPAEKDEQEAPVLRKHQNMIISLM